MSKVLEPQVDPIIKDEVSKKTPKEIVNEYLQDPQVKQNLLETAIMFKEKTSGNWFGIEKIQKKTPWKEVEAINNILHMMILADFCGVKIENGVHKFKITLQPKEKASILRSEIISLQDKISLLEKEIERLETT